jgi:hypothetical protein
MCTWIVEKAAISGSAKGPGGWFVVNRAVVAYDHPSHAPLEHALLIDFTDESKGPGARVAVELTRESGQALVRAIEAALAASN